MPESSKAEPGRRAVLKKVGTIGGTAVATGVAGCAGGTESGGSGGGTSGGTESPTRTEGSAQTDAGGTTGGGGANLEHQFGYSHYPTITNTTPVVVGIDQGMFEENGVSISEVTSFSGGGTATRGITTGGLGIGGSAVSSTVQGFMAGATVRLVGMYMQSNGTVFQTQPDSEFSTIQDLKGETVAVTNPGSVTESALVVSAMRAEGVSLEDIEITYAGGLGEALTLLTEGDVAASMNIQPTATQYEMEGRARTMWSTFDYAPEYASYCILASDTLISDSPGVVEGVIGGLADSFAYVKDNVEESARIWGNEADVSEDIAIQSLKALNPDQMFGLAPTQEGLQTAEQIMKQLGKIDGTPPWSELIDQQFLPEDARVDWLE